MYRFLQKLVTDVQVDRCTNKHEFIGLFAGFLDFCPIFVVFPFAVKPHPFP